VLWLNPIHTPHCNFLLPSSRNDKEGRRRRPRHPPRPPPPIQHSGSNTLGVKTGGVEIVAKGTTPLPPRHKYTLRGFTHTSAKTETQKQLYKRSDKPRVTTAPSRGKDGRSQNQWYKRPNYQRTQSQTHTGGKDGRIHTVKTDAHVRNTVKTDGT
jgi:hypothetical protein